MTTNGSPQLVVGYDGSPDAKRALAWAADLARAKKAPLRVVVAFGDLRVRRVTELDAEWERAHEADLSADARAAVADLEDTSLEISQHAPAPAILGEADQSSVVVMGSRGHGRLAEAFIGSVSQHVARHASGTVVVVREPSSPEATEVVVGVDGSVGCRPALEFAFDYAGTKEAPLHAVYVWEQAPQRVGYPTAPVAGEDVEMTGAEAVIGETLRPYREKYPGVTVQTSLVPGSAVRVLADASEHAALLVVGSRGRGAFESLLLGSVGQGLLHHARCPVAIAR